MKWKPNSVQKLQVNILKKRKIKREKPLRIEHKFENGKQKKENKTGTELCSIKKKKTAINLKAKVNKKRFKKKD